MRDLECTGASQLVINALDRPGIGPIVRSPAMNANLVTLDVSLGPISQLTGISADQEEIGKLPNLERLWIARTPVTNAAVRAFRKAHPKVTVHY